MICAPLNLAFIRVVYRCAVDYGEATWPPACSFGSLVPANVRESSALNQSLMESLPGVVCVFDSWGNIGRWNSNFLGYSAADIMRTGIIGTVAPESLQAVRQISKPIKLEELFSVIANVVRNIHRSPEAKDLVRR